MIDMVPARQRKRHPFLYGLVLVALCGMICAFAAIIGVFALVNAKEKPIEYSREELAELFVHRRKHSDI